jgi:hypothetical protein
MMEACSEIAQAIHGLSAVVLLAVVVWAIFK